MLDIQLLGKTRAAILRELFLNADRRISFNELVRLTGSGDGAVSRDVKALMAAGLVIEEREGNQRFLKANQTSPVYAELKSLISKSSGAPLILREALRGVEDKIAVAFIFGSVANGTERGDNDLDLFVVGSAGYSVLTERVSGLENRLGRPVTILYFNERSEADRKSLRKPAMKAIARGKKLFVLGDQARLEGLMS